MKNTWKKTLAGILAFTIIIGAAPVDIGGLGLVGGKSISASAICEALQDDPTTLIIGSNYHSWSLNNYYIDASEVKNYENKKNIKKVIFASEDGRYLSFVQHSAQFEGDYTYLFEGYDNLEEVDFEGSKIKSSSTDFTGMFKNCKKLTTVKNLNVYYQATAIRYYPINISGMFEGCTSLTTLDGFDLSRVENMSGLFKNCSDNLTPALLSQLDTSSATNMSGMFQGCTGVVDLDLSNFNTSSVTDMSSMFDGCTNLRFLNLSSFDTTSLNKNTFINPNSNSIERMFADCKNLEAICVGDNWNVSNVKTSTEMFAGDTKLFGTIGKWTGHQSTYDKTYAKINTSSTEGYLSKTSDYKLSQADETAFAEYLARVESGELVYAKRAYTANKWENNSHVDLNSGNKKFIHDNETKFYEVKYAAEVPATVNTTGTKEHSYVEVAGAKSEYFYDEEKGIYYKPKTIDLTIPKIGVNAVAQVEPTYTEDGTKAHYLGDDEKLYLFNETTGLYEETTSEALVIPKLLGEHHDAVPATFDSDGTKEYYNGNPSGYYIPDGNGGYTYTENGNDLIDPKITLGEPVEAKEPTYTEDGNIEYYVGSDGNYYVANENGGYTKVDEDDVKIDKLTLYLQADTYNSTNAVDLNIYAPLPDGADPSDYTITFGDESVLASECDKKELTFGGTQREYYIVKVSSPARKMRDQIAYSIKHGDTVDKSGSTSVRGYADAVIDGGYSEGIKKTCRAMLAYGTAAQVYKNYDPNGYAVDEALVGTAGLDYSNVVLPTGYTFNKDDLNTALADANAPVSYYGMAIDMNADTNINLAFKITSDITQEAAVEYLNNHFKIDGSAVSAENNTNEKFVIFKTSGIKIVDLLGDHTMSFYPNGFESSGSDYLVNVKQYMSSVANRDDSEISVQLKNICKSLLNYYYCAIGNSNS